MTQEEWQAASDPEPMLAFLRGTAGDRKLRLWACACCRRVWLWLAVAAKAAVVVAERFADGDATSAKFSVEVLNLASGETTGLLRGLAYHHGSIWNPDHVHAAAEVAYHSRLILAHGGRRPGSATGPPERDEQAKRTQASIVRCVFGDPFRPVAFDPSWRTEAAVGLAAGIHDERAFERLPILADALEEAGCEDESLLTHCREPGVHVRGCWVVDLVLGKA